MRPLTDIWKDLYDVVSLLRVQVAITILTIILLLVPAQILEVYTVMASDVGSFWLQLIMTFLGVGFFTLMSWYSGRRLTLYSELDTLNAASGSHLKQGLVQWVPRILAILPVGSLAAIWIIDPRFASQEGAKVSIAIFQWSGVVLLAATIVFFLFVTYRTKFGSLFSQSSSSFVNAERTYDTGEEEDPVKAMKYGLDRTIRFVYITAFGLPIAVFLAVVLAPIEFPKAMGTILFVTVFMGGMAFYLSAAQLIYKRYNIPATFLVIAMILIWSLLDINDNHRIRTETVEVTKELELPKAFETWLKARKDRDHYSAENTKYPVYIIAAEGGGIYAAHHAAVWLSRMQDICPSFAQHVFAISGISGGSVGASVFAGLIDSDLPDHIKSVQNDRYQPCKMIEDNEVRTRGGEYEQHADDVLSADLLSPLVAGMLSTDFAQRFLPYPIEVFDRARALEDAIVDGWADAGFEKTLLTRPIVNAWRPDGVAPALVLNTTRVDTGERVVAAPFRMKWNQSEIRSVGHYGQPGEDVSIRTAAALSARFTYVTPAGWVKSDPGRDLGHKIRLVDGGYFENSGVDTASDIWDAVNQIAGDLGAEVRIISLTYKTQATEPSYTLGETWSPINALLATRGNRGRLALKRAQSQLAGSCLNGTQVSSVCDEHTDINDPVRVSYLHDYDGKLPLGWLLSKSNRDVIRRQIGWPDRCELVEGKVPNVLDDGAKIVHWNACVLYFIREELQHGIKVQNQ